MGFDVGVIGEGVGGRVVCCNGLCVGDEEDIATTVGISVLLIAMVLANQTVPIYTIPESGHLERECRAASFAMDRSGGRYCPSLSKKPVHF